MEFYGTLGTACQDRSTVRALFQAGMTGARLNLSHAGLAACTGSINDVFWPAARAEGVDAKLMIDLQGPELRVGQLPHPMRLKEGSELLLGDGGVPIPEAVLRCARKGHQISLDDSALLLEVRRTSHSVLLCRVVRGGLLQSKKSLAILGVQSDAPALTQADLDDLDQARRFGVTHILQPFVRGPEDLQTLRDALHARGLDDLQVMAKIESRQGMDRLEEIMGQADQICIARGDLGNAIPLWEVPSAQKSMARRCRAAKKAFCLVTQLLWSMERRPVPTRAEVCDIYNGVLDGADSLMLTGETAVGKYPVQAMEYLVKTARRAMEDMEQAGR